MTTKVTPFKQNILRNRQKSILLSFYISIGIFFLFIWFPIKPSLAQSYFQTEIGLGTGRYRPIDSGKLDRDEHDFILGSMLNLEVGRMFGSKKIVYSIGGKIQYNLRALRGTYTFDTWEPNKRINAHISSFLLALGINFRVTANIGVFFKANLGPSYVVWVDEGKFVGTFWKFYPPLNVGIYYKFSTDWHAIGGISFVPPIYLSNTTNVMVGIKRIF